MVNGEMGKRLVLGEPLVVTDLAEGTMIDFARSTAEETKQLTEDLKLLEDVLAFRGFEENMSVELVVCILADDKEVSTFMKSLDVNSKVRNDYSAAARIVTFLTTWRTKEVISLFDTLPEAIAQLKGRIVENHQILGKAFRDKEML